MKEHVGCGCFPTGRHYPGIAHLLRVRASGTLPGLDADAAWLDLPIAMLDTETTGREAQSGQIVELGIVVGLRGEVLRRHNWLIKPAGPIPKEATDVHGITDDDVKDAPSFAEIAGEIVEALRGVVPAAYNASFDKAFVSAEFARCPAGVPTSDALRVETEWVDPLVWARELQKYEKSKKLGDVAARLGVSLENAHRASDDAEAALRVLYLFAEDARMPRTYGALLLEQKRLGRAQDESYSFWRARNAR